VGEQLGRRKIFPAGYKQKIIKGVTKMREGGEKKRALGEEMRERKWGTTCNTSKTIPRMANFHLSVQKMEKRGDRRPLLT